MASDDNTRQQHDIVEPEEELEDEEELKEPKNTDEQMKDFTGNDPHLGHTIADEINEDEKALVGKTGPHKKKKLKPVLQ